jgi:hypothetical protein
MRLIAPPDRPRQGLERRGKQRRSHGVILPRCFERRAGRMRDAAVFWSAHPFTEAIE